MTRVATKMSADARDTRNRFCGAFRARLVNTATTTRTLPTTVPSIMMVTTSTMQTDATCEWGGRGGDLGEEADVWLFSKEEFGRKEARMVAIADGNISKSILVKCLTLESPFLASASKCLTQKVQKQRIKSSWLQKKVIKLYFHQL